MPLQQSDQKLLATKEFTGSVGLIAALPMYDWPEVRTETDAQWEQLRDELRCRGIDAPERLARTRRDLPSIPGTLRDAGGKVIASDPANLQASELDLNSLWLHPELLLAQACWGPMERGLADHIQIVGQPGYDGIEGGEGPRYSSAIIMRGGEANAMPSPLDGSAAIPLDLLRGRRFSYNDVDSMSGILALASDLKGMGETLDIFSHRKQSGSHRRSIKAVAEGAADLAAIDCKTFALARHFEPAARDVTVVGWTARRKGLPFITSRHTPIDVVTQLRQALMGLGWCLS